jgi:hypothetical protein
MDERGIEIEGGRGVRGMFFLCRYLCRVLRRKTTHHAVNAIAKKLRE